MSRVTASKDRVRAATLVAPGRYEIRDYPVPDPAPGCVVVRMALSGICGTDKHTYQGYTTQYAGTEAAKEIPFPIIQGHENVGTVAAIGPTPSGRPYTDFDAEKLTVTLPQDQEVRVRVRLVPTQELSRKATTAFVVQPASA